MAASAWRSVPQVTVHPKVNRLTAVYVVDQYLLKYELNLRRTKRWSDHRSFVTAILWEIKYSGHSNWTAFPVSMWERIWHGQSHFVCYMCERVTPDNGQRPSRIHKFGTWQVKIIIHFMVFRIIYIISYKGLNYCICGVNFWMISGCTNGGWKTFDTMTQSSCGYCPVARSLALHYNETEK